MAGAQGYNCSSDWTVSISAVIAIPDRRIAAAVVICAERATRTEIDHRFSRARQQPGQLYLGFSNELPFFARWTEWPFLDFVLPSLADRKVNAFVSICCGAETFSSIVGE
jgi:hypothetical protein